MCIRDRPGLVPGLVPAGSGVTFVSDSGAVGYGPLANSPMPDFTDSSGRGVVLSPGGTVLSTVDLAGMTRAGYVDIALLQPFQVGEHGTFSHWTSASTPGLLPAGTSVELAGAARRLVLMLPHTQPNLSLIHISEPTRPY